MIITRFEKALIMLLDLFMKLMEKYYKLELQINGKKIF